MVWYPVFSLVFLPLASFSATAPRQIRQLWISSYIDKTRTWTSSQYVKNCSHVIRSVCYIGFVIGCSFWFFEKRFSDSEILLKVRKISPSRSSCALRNEHLEYRCSAKRTGPSWQPCCKRVHSKISYTRCLESDKW
jgi:hypothetical protein